MCTYQVSFRSYISFLRYRVETKKVSKFICVNRATNYIWHYGKIDQIFFLLNLDFLAELRWSRTWLMIWWMASGRRNRFRTIS
jgi:hypothetical protein